MEIRSTTVATLQATRPPDGTIGFRPPLRVFPGKRNEEWAPSDPAGWDSQGVRPIWDEIEQMVLALLVELGVPAGT